MNLKEINDFLGNYNNIIALAGAMAGIIALFYVGGKVLKNNKLNMGNSKIKDSQVANEINNGISVADAEYIAGKTVDEKTKNKPDIVISKEEPTDAPEGSIWLKIDE